MSPHLQAEHWRRLSPYLDIGLEHTGQARVDWLATLRAEDATLAAEVESLLSEQEALNSEGFLETMPQEAPPASLAGCVLGPYTLRSPVGEGGMGNVWLAERSDGRFQGLVAVKLLNASLIGAGESRFRREGSILARLRHPHIAHLIDAGVSPLGHPYLVLEHVDGQRIDTACDERRLGVEARVRLFLDVAAAVAHAHASLVVHRDLKPSNVLVDREGQVKLLDFGIAKLLDAEEEGTDPLTRAGEMALTPEYAAPEQVTGEHVTTATDVHGLGLLLYVLLCGQHPLGATRRTAPDMLRAVVEVEPRRLSEAAVAAGGALSPDEVAARRGTTPARLRARLRGDLDNIVARALQKRPQDRYLSVSALADDLRRFLAHEPVSARPDGAGYRLAKFVRRNRMAVELSALALLALAAGVAGTVTQARRATRQAARAEGERARADAEARQAGEQRDFALRQLNRSEATSELNAFLLRDAAPSGKPFTVGALLTLAEDAAGRQPDEHTRVGMLVQVGRQYHLLEQDAKAHAVLGRAYDEAARGSDPTLRAEAACALGASLAVVGQQERAEQLIQEAQGLLPPQRQFDLLRVACDLSGSEVAQEGNDTGTGLARAQDAQRIFRESQIVSLPLEFSIMTHLGESYRLSGRYAEADAALKGAFDQLVQVGRDHTETAAGLLNSWALAARGQGQVLTAERRFRQAIQIMTVDGRDDSVSPLMLANLARVLRDLERFAEAIRYGERTYAAARRQGHEIAMNQALMVLANAHRQRGDLAPAARALVELEARFKRLLPPRDLQFASLAMEQGCLLTAQGHAAAGLARADEAVALAEAGRQQPQYLRRLLVQRSELNLQAGRAEAAAADAQRGLEMEQAAVGPGATSSMIGLGYMALARARLAQGRAAEAQRAATAALPHLVGCLGEGHSATRAARQMSEGRHPS